MYWLCYIKKLYIHCFRLLHILMKIIWKPLVHPIVSTMKVWETWFVSTDSVIITTKDNIYNLFLDLDGIIISEQTEFHNIPIMRYSDAKDGYQVDISWPIVFCPTIEEVDPTNSDYKQFIWPYLIEWIMFSEEAFREKSSIEELEKYLTQLEENEEYIKAKAVKNIIDRKKKEWRDPK